MGSPFIFQLNVFLVVLHRFFRLTHPFRRLRASFTSSTHSNCNLVVAKPTYALPSLPIAHCMVTRIDFRVDEALKGTASVQYSKIRYTLCIVS